MDFGSLLVLFDGSKGSQEALRMAIATGQKFSAYLEVLHVQPSSCNNPELLAFQGSGAAAIESLKRIELEHDSRMIQAREMFLRHCADAALPIVETETDDWPVGRSVCWRHVYGHEAPEVARRGRLMDLIVMPRADAESGGVDSAVLEAALYDSGRPVIVAAGEPSDPVGDNIAIAWDGSREAAHSVGLALPFLKTASNVVVLCVSDGRLDPDPEDLRRYLERHEIPSSGMVISKRDESIATLLLREARQRRANLLIMGAFGNEPTDADLLGGVTQELLSSAEIPLFMAH